MKTTIIYWSGTGNTEQMARLVAQGAGADAALKTVSDAGPADIDAADAVALGCPAMGDEVLEESEFEPFMQDIEGKLAGKRVALFGSYDWGDGQWMREWQERVETAGATVVSEGLIVCGAPAGDTEQACVDLGKALAG